MYGHRESAPTPIVKKRLSFLSITVLCLTAVLVTILAGAFGVVVYGMRIVDGKTDSLTGMITEAARSLPEFRKALPPALSDALDDVRRPDYVAQIDARARVIDKSPHGYARAVVEITNKGDEVVSLLGLRVVGVNEDGDSVVEESTLVATPLQIENDWRGPLMPGATRRIPLRFREMEGITEVHSEITDIRVWTPGAASQIAPITVADGTSNSN